MEGAKQKIPPALQKIKEQIRSSEAPATKRDPGNRKTPKASESKSEWDDENTSRGEGVPPWKQKRQNESSRDDRPSQPEHQWEDRSESGEGGKAGQRLNKARSSNSGWRDGPRHEFKDDSTPAAPSTLQHQNDEQESKKRETVRKTEAGSESQETAVEGREDWQVKSRGTGRRPTGGRGKEHGHEDRYTSSPMQQHEESGSRSERPPWSKPSLDGHNESRRMGNARSQASNNDQLGSWSERKADGNETGNSKGGQSDANTKKPKVNTGEKVLRSTRMKN